MAGGRGTGNPVTDSAKDAKALGWLLEPDQPSIRYLALTRLSGKDEDDPEVVAARERIAERGWASELLARQEQGGWWVHEESLYRPKYLATNWMLLILSDFGLTKEHPRIRKACELWIKRFAKEDGGFGIDGSKGSHLCTTGNMARALVRFGYADHPKVKSAFGWMARNASHLGGWSCFGSGRNLDSWEPLSAFAAYPRERWTPEMSRAVELAAEFFLERELHKQGDRYEPWYRFHYPVHYYYDVLVGLDFLTALGYGKDPRLGFAVSLLEKKRRADGRWNLEAIHPDLVGGQADWYRKHPKDTPTPFALEEIGRPSKMLTLRAMQVLRRINDSG